MRGALWAPQHREVVVALRGCCGEGRMLWDREVMILFVLEQAVQVLLGGHEFGVEGGQVGEDVFGFFL